MAKWAEYKQIKKESQFYDATVFPTLIAISVLLVLFLDAPIFIKLIIIIAISFVSTQQLRFFLQIKEKRKQNPYFEAVKLNKLKQKNNNNNNEGILYDRDLL